MRLKQMTLWHKELFQAGSYTRRQPPRILSVEEHIAYTVSLCGLTHAILANPDLVTCEPLLWKYQEVCCNCIFFELHRRSIDAARRLLGLTLLPEKAADETLYHQARTMIGVLRYVADITLHEWEDAPIEVFEGGRHGREDVDLLMGYLRAYCAWYAASKCAHPKEEVRLRNATELYAAAHQILKSLPCIYDLTGQENKYYEPTEGVLRTGTPKPIVVPSSKDIGKYKNRPKPSTKPVPWCQRVHLDLLQAAGNWFWQWKPLHAVRCYQLAFHNGDTTYTAEQLDAKEIEANNINKALIERGVYPAPEEWERWLVEDLKVPTEICKQGCSPLPPPPSVDAQAASPSRVCVKLRCGSLAHTFVLANP